MSADQADRSAKQFEQSTPKSTAEHSKSSRLHEQYKPVGIQAVSAAAHFSSTARKKTPQMS